MAYTECEFDRGQSISPFQVFCVSELEAKSLSLEVQRSTHYGGLNDYQYYGSIFLV